MDVNKVSYVTPTILGPPTISGAIFTTLSTDEHAQHGHEIKRQKEVYPVEEQLRGVIIR